MSVVIHRSSDSDSNRGKVQVDASAKNEQVSVKRAGLSQNSTVATAAQRTLGEMATAESQGMIVSATLDFSQIEAFEAKQVAILQAETSANFQAIKNILGQSSVEDRSKILFSLNEETLRQLEGDKSVSEAVHFTKTIRYLLLDPTSVSDEKLLILINHTYTDNDIEQMQEVINTTTANSVGSEIRAFLDDPVLSLATIENLQNALKAVKSAHTMSASAGTDADFDAVFAFSYSSERAPIFAKLLATATNDQVKRLNEFCKIDIATDVLQKTKFENGLKAYTIYTKLIRKQGCSLEEFEHLLSFPLSDTRVAELIFYLKFQENTNKHAWAGLLAMQLPEDTSFVTVEILRANLIQVKKLLAQVQDAENLSKIEKTSLAFALAPVCKLSSFDDLFINSYISFLKKIDPNDVMDAIKELPYGLQKPYFLKIVEYDLDHNEDLTQDHFYMLNDAVEVPSRALVERIMTKVQTPTSDDEKRFKKWTELLQGMFTSQMDALDKLSVLLFFSNKQPVDKTLFEEYYATLPIADANSHLQDKISKVLAALQTVSDISAGTSLYGCNCQSLEGFRLSDTIAASIVNALKNNEKNDLGARFVVRHPSLVHSTSVTWGVLATALHEADVLNSAYTNRNALAPQERVDVLQKVLPYLDPEKEIGPFLHIQEEIRDALSEQAWEKYKSAQYTIEDLNVLLHEPFTNEQQQQLLIDLQSRESPIRTRFLQLKAAHSKWSDLACLQKAVRQRVLIEKMSRENDVSLADVAGLLRRHLTDSEKVELQTILRNKTNGVMAQKIIGKNEPLDEAIGDIVTDIVEAPLTYASLTALKGVPLTEAQATKLLQHLSEANRASTIDPHLQAIEQIFTDFKAAVKKKTGKEPSSNTALPIALSVYWMLNRSKSTSLMAQKVFHAPETHLPGTVSEVGESIVFSMSNAEVKKLTATKLLGKGTFKKCELCFQIIKSENISRNVRYSVVPRARLIAKGEAVHELVEEIENGARFQGQGRFVQLHGFINYGKPGVPKLAAIYDLCDGSLDQISRTVKQHISNLHGVLEGTKAMHDANMLHRDFKPQNILIQVDTSSSSDPTQQKTSAFVADLNLSRQKQSKGNFNANHYCTRQWTSPDLYVNPDADPFLVEAYAIGASFLALKEGKEGAPGYIDFVDNASETYSADRVSRMKEQLAKYQRKFQAAIDKIESASRQDEIPTEEEVLNYIIAKLIHTDFSTPTKPTAQGRWTVTQALTKLDELLGKIERARTTAQNAQSTTSVRPQTQISASAPLRAREDATSIHI